MSAANRNVAGGVHSRATRDGAFAAHAIVNREIYSGLVTAIAARCDACRVRPCRYPRSQAIVDIVDKGRCGAFPLILAKHRIDTDS